MNTYKGVDYAYPSSVSATKCGHARTGCWTIVVYTHHDDGSVTSSTSATGYTDRAAAFAAAAQRREPWSAIHKRYSRHAIAQAEGIPADEVYPRPKQGDHYE